MQGGVLHEGDLSIEGLGASHVMFDTVYSIEILFAARILVCRVLYLTQVLNFT